LAALLGQRHKVKDKDLFELPPLPKDEGEDDDSDSDREDILSAINVDHSTDLHQVIWLFRVLEYFKGDVS